ncbi:MAG TPA: sigma 54-interacting transcriptional regulator [Thermoguttaceae bacterium]|nr:sigma 54-interacting transcriptional regulator [Thermoguttaceae bacterium]
MQKSQHVLQAVWREACRHIEIGQSVRTITSMLIEDVPLAQLVVRRIDPRRGCVETVALGIPGGEFASLDTLTPCSAAELRRLTAWANKGQISRRARFDAMAGELKIAMPQADHRDLIAGPLRGADGALGILVLVAAEKAGFTPSHAAIAEVLLDPFGAALANDQRLREMTAMQQAAEAENQSLLQRLGRKRLDDTIVGGETGLRDVMERIELVAGSDAPVLIFGETGTGKELIARAIHSRSHRAAGPVLRVNCGAIPSELIDSELFGHERGAFTGAVESRKGWFERADGGTLFLDEIGELPGAAQVRLLRILQDGWLERVGGEQPIHVDVRIVAATHCDLAEMVAQGAFRADLWYRVAVFPMVLPPLRERREDIAELSAHFAQRAATRFGLAEVLPTPDDLRLLAAYHWPGNVRELGTVIDRAAILGNGRRLEVSKALGVDAALLQRNANSLPMKQSVTPAEIVPLDDVICAHIEAALVATAGRVEGPQGAAALLGINPNTLRGRMRKLKVDWRKFRG